MNRLLVNVVMVVFGLTLAPLASAELPAPESEDPVQLALQGLDPILLAIRPLRKMAPIRPAAYPVVTLGPLVSR